MNGTSPLSIGLDPAGTGSFARNTWPPFVQSTELPSGARIGLAIAPTRHDTPGFATFAAQSACSLPSGSPVGLAFHPSRLAAWPRTNMTVDPSAEILNPLRSLPSSFMYDV